MPTDDPDNNARSGFYLLSDNTDAFVARIALAEKATRSLDIQYYIIHSDASGRSIAYALLQAADRGVSVRILVDDINLAGRDSRLKMLAQHDNIEIRIFNALRQRGWFRSLELVINLGRAGRRMHNKLFIVDGRYAIIGGRNIGDEYFDARKSLNFVDLDLLTTGGIIGDIEQSFEEYWSSRWSTPIEQISRIRVMKSHLKNVRNRLRDFWRKYRNSEYFRRVRDSELSRKIDSNTIDYIWAQAHLLYDEPDKVSLQDSNNMVHFGPRVMPLFESAEKKLQIASPYFVPGDAGTQWMIDKKRTGVDFAVLTNSLAATDVPAVHAGYKRYRQRLLDNGISLYELTRDAISRTSRSEWAMRHRPHSSLHAKYIIIDEKLVLTGSANIDPRSSNLNTEIAVVIQSRELAVQICELFERTTSLENSYQLSLSSGRIRWQTHKGGRMKLYSHDPGTHVWKRVYVWLLGLLPFESLL